MTPEQERKLLDRIDGVHGAVRNLGDNVGEAVQRIVRLEQSGKLTRSWLRRLIDDYEARNKTSLRPPRDPMPSLGADDSGAIDVSALGAHARFQGKWPVVAAIAFLASLLAFGGGIALTRASVAPVHRINEEIPK